MRRVAAVLAFTAVTGAAAGPAWAQSAYIGGAVAAEVVRTSSTKSGGTTYDSGSGEAFAGAIRIGTFLTDRVGVELEYYRPGELESDAGGLAYIAGGRSYSWTSSDFDLLMPIDPSYPSIIGQTMRVRTSTTSALLTARQPLGSRVDLVFLGGVGFSRVVREVEYSFPSRGLPLGPSIQRSSSSRTTQYAAGPVAGVEVRAGMTEHAQVVAGVRMHALGQNVVDGWMIRPNVGLAWKF
jgi:hypothetical protein